MQYLWPIGILGQVWYLIVSISDLCILTYCIKIPHDFQAFVYFWVAAYDRFHCTGNICKNFIFKNTFKGYICHIKNSWLGHDLPTSVNGRVISPFCKGSVLTKFHKNKSLAKICEITVYLTQISHTIHPGLNGPRRKKTCLRGFANNKGADQPGHPCSLISTFIIRLFEIITSKLATSKFSIVHWGDWFEPRSVGNPKDRYRRDNNGEECST